MAEDQDNAALDSVNQDAALKKAVDWYDRTNIAYAFRVLQPTGVFLTAIGLILAAWGLGLSHQEIAESRKVRQATLFVMLTERLDVARSLDAGRAATYESDKLKKKWKCTGTKQLRAEVGQIIVLERMNSLNISLNNIKANDVNLVVRQGRKAQNPGISLPGAILIDADLSNSNLSHADLSGAKLMKADLDKSCLEGAMLSDTDLTEADAVRADFKGADLSDADLVGARLRYARFWRANLSGAKLTNADITGAHLVGADGLEQVQLDQACANPKKLPPSVPRGLKWNERDCP